MKNKLKIFIPLFGLFVGLCLGSVANAALTVPTPAQMDAKYQKLINEKAYWSLAAYFDRLLVLARLTGNIKYLEVMLKRGAQLTTRTARATHQIDKITGRSNGSVLLSTYYSCGTPVAYMVHHGVVWSPVVAGVYEYLASAEARSHANNVKKANLILQTALGGLNYFDHQIIEKDGKKRYGYPEFPVKCEDQKKLSGDEIALNMAAASGSLAIELVDILTAPKSVRKYLSKKFATFKNLVEQRAHIAVALNSIAPELEDTNTGVIWKYRPNSDYDDMPHAAVVVKFLVAAMQTSRLVRSYIDGVEETLYQMLKNGPAKVSSNLGPVKSKGKDVRVYGDKKYVGGLAQWIDLALPHCSVLNKIAQIQNYKNSKGQKIYYSGVLQEKYQLYSKVCKK